MLKPSTYADSPPFRINPDLSPGALTARMAVPWQADFFDCQLQTDPDDDPDNPENGMDWWPAQRPVNVIRDGSPQSEWASDVTSYDDMVDKWRGLGFVVQEKGTDRFIETERSLNKPST
jgi:hypothetical protein